MKKSLILSASLMLVLGSCLIGCNNNNGENDPGEPEVEMTASYKKARDEFKIVTGIELPKLEGLEVEEYPFNESNTSYCFDIIGGDNLSYATYVTFEEFFLMKLGNCDEGFPTGDENEGRSAEWTTSSLRWYQTYWDATNQSVYINTFIRVE